MSYLVILLVLIVALSPLFSMMPSRRQRALADLRQAAATSGLYVELLADENGVPGSAGVFYGCRRQRGDETGGGAHYRLEADGWTPGSGAWPDARLALLEELPAGVTEIKEDFVGIGVVWDESGSPQDVASIALTLRRLLGRHY